MRSATRALTRTESLVVLAHARVLAIALLLCCGSAAASGQAGPVQSSIRPPVLPESAPAPTSFGAAFTAEALDGITGAALVYGALLLTDSDGCGEDLTCALRHAGTALLAATTGAAVGTHAAGRILAIEPNGWGAVAGALAGAAPVIGLDHTLGDMHDGVHVAVFSSTHGMLTALGSRLAVALR